MSEFVKFVLDDGTEVFFQSAEGDLVELHSGGPDVSDGGRLATRLEAVASAARQVAKSLRSQLTPDEVALEFGVGVSGEVGWFFAKSQVEGTIKVTTTWRRDGGGRPGDSDDQ